MITPIGNFPAGYECQSAYYVSADKSVATSIWLVPGGGPVYAHAHVPSPDDTYTEAFWERIVEHVQQHVRSRLLGLQSYTNGVSTYKGMALSDRPPPATGDEDVSQPQPPQGYEGVRTAPGTYDV